MKRIPQYIKRQISVMKLLRALKLHLLYFSPFLKKGKWIVEARFAYHTSARDHKFITLFERIVPSNSGKTQIIPRLINIFFVYSTAKIKSSQSEVDASILYKSRAGDLKLFDLGANLVYSTASEVEWLGKYKALSSPLFQYFGAPDAKFLTISGQAFIVETLIEAKDLTILDSTSKAVVYKKLINRYSNYVTSESLNNNSIIDLSIEVFDEVSSKATNGGCVQLEGKRQAYIAFVSRLKYVEAHLDFNIANVLYDGKFYLLDNDHVGLILPAFYDIVNIAFNQITYWNDTEWFELLLSGKVLPSFIDFCRVCVDDFKEEELVLIFLVYFVFQKSNLVSARLRQAEKSSAQIAREYSRLINLPISKIY